MKGTYNLPFSEIHPKFRTVVPTGTTIEPTLRTTSSTSVSGSEGSFIDQGFEPFSLRELIILIP